MEKTGKIKVEVTYIHSFQYKDYSFSYYGTVHYIHIFKDSENNSYVWKTTAILNYKDKDGNSRLLNNNAQIELTGTIKGIEDYKGTPQTSLSRCKFKVIKDGKSKAEIEKEKKEAEKQKREQQLKSLNGKDFIWNMPYRQYKSHYSDCETIAGSYNDPVDSKGIRHGIPTIDVIIREGRLKASGVRGKHYNTFVFERKEDNTAISFYAISEETATKQLIKNGYNPEDFEDCYIEHYGG